MSTRKIAILGGGRIGEALLSGLLSSGWRDPSEVVVTSRREERVGELHEKYGAEATTDNAAAVADVGVVVVAVKPQDIDVLLGEIGAHLTTEQTLVSVAAAITTAHIEERIAEDIPTNHNPRFAPVIHPTLETGIEAMTTAALDALVS